MRVRRVVVVAILLSCLGCTDGLKVGAFLGSGADATLPVVVDASDAAVGARDASDVLIGEPGVDAAKPCLAISFTCDPAPQRTGAVSLTSTITDCGSAVSGPLTVWTTTGVYIATDGCSGAILKRATSCTLTVQYIPQDAAVPMNARIDVSDGTTDACAMIRLDDPCRNMLPAPAPVDGGLPVASTSCTATSPGLDAAPTGG